MLLQLQVRVSAVAAAAAAAAAASTWPAMCVVFSHIMVMKYEGGGTGWRLDEVELRDVAAGFIEIEREIGSDKGDNRVGGAGA